MIGLSDNQLEVIMRVAAPLSEGKCQEFLERVAAAVAVVLEMRGQINDDDIAVARWESTRPLLVRVLRWQRGADACCTGSRNFGIGRQRFSRTRSRGVKISIISSDPRAPQNPRPPCFD